MRKCRLGFLIVLLFFSVVMVPATAQSSHVSAKVENHTSDAWALVVVPLVNSSSVARWCVPPGGSSQKSIDGDFHYARVLAVDSSCADRGLHYFREDVPLFRNEHFTIILSGSHGHYSVRGWHS
jgi:hypothetical protein